MKARIEVRTDGGKQWGIGHIRRSQTLAAALRGAGYRVCLRACSSEAEKFLTETADFSDPPELLIFDVPYDFGASVADRPVKILALDYSGSSFQPDLTISVFEPRKPPPPGLRFSGLQYAIIRADVVALRAALGPPGISRMPTNERVLVLLGGADVAGRGPVLSKMLTSRGFHVDLIQGPAVSEAYPDTESSIRVHRSPANLPELMASCAWAVSNGGASMLELMTLGKPVFVVPQTSLETALSKEIEGHGALLGSGEELPEIPDEAAMRTAAQNAWSLVDGKGPERIIRLMEQFAL